MCFDFDFFKEYVKLYENELEEEIKQIVVSFMRNVMIKCSECGIVILDQELMRVYMWVYINSLLKKEVITIEIVEKNMKYIVYKCFDCDFICEEVKVFVVYMVKYKFDLQIVVLELKKYDIVLFNEF